MKKVVSLFLSILMLANVIICVDLTAYADSVNPSESKQYQMFKADYYSNNFNFDTPSFAKEYYDDMKNDTAFMSFLATWEVGHIATSPSHAMESGMITLKEYYKAVLFDLFAQSNSETGLTDQLLKMVKNSELSYIVSVTKTISKPLSEISQDNISYEGLSKISAQDAADAIKKSGLYQGTEMYGIVTKIAGWAKDAKSLVEAFSKYLAIADLNDGTKEILNIIANDSQNPNELREAAADCVSYFGEGYEKVLNQILAGTWDITVGVFDTVADVALDWAWGMIIGSITTATGGAIGSAVLLGAKGIRVFSNFLFNVDKDVESFYQIKAAVVCEDAMKRVIANIHNQGYLSSSFELSNLYNQAVEAFEKTVLLGFDYSIGLLKNSSEAPAIKYTNLLFGKYDECMKLIGQISGFKNDKIQIFSKFEDKCLNAFKKEYCLDFDDVIYGLEHQNIPIDSIELTQIKDFTVGLTNECMFNYVKAEFLPEAHTEIAFESWRSSDNSVIEIVNDTSFTVHKEGSCTLTCYLSSGVSADITVTVGESQGGYEYDYDNFEFSFNDNDLTAKITDYTGLVSRLAIPSKIGKYTVKSIGYMAFEDCTSLTSITIPDSVTSMGWGPFAYCTALQNIYVDSGNKNYCSINGVLFNKNITYIVCYPAGKTDSVYTIPDSVWSMDLYAFSGCTSLARVTIPNSVTSIAYSAFFGCTSLTSITIPDSVRNIDYYAFENCDSLVDVYYTGSETDWNNISICGGNEDLATATIHYNHVHSYNNANIIEATCTKNGTKSYTCIECGAFITEVIPTIGHTYDDGVITTAPTCTRDGTKTYTCTVCGYEKTETVSAVDHNYTTQVTEPSCTTQGYTTYTCSNCGDSYVSDYIKPSHNYVNGICTVCGYYNSITCGNTLDIDIANAGDVIYVYFTPDVDDSYIFYSTSDYDTYVTLYDENMNGLKSDDDSGNDSNFLISYDFEAGKTYIFACKMWSSSATGSFQVTLEEHEHSYSSEIVEPTCTSRGYTRCTCSCGDSFTTDYVDVLGHNYVDGTCTRCGKVESDFEFELLDDETIRITEYTGTETDVTVPSSIGEYIVKEVSYSAFDDCDLIQSITFSEGIERIYCICTNCPNLDTINLPSTVNELEESSFANPSNIETVIGNGNNNEDYIIEGMSGNLKNINVSSENPYYCSIDGVLFTKNVDELLRYPSGKEATIYEIPDTVKTFSSFAFAFCGNIEKLIIPASVETINNQMFVLLKYVKMDGYQSISELKSDFKGFEVSSDNTNYCSVDGVLYTKDMNTLIAYPNGKIDNNFVTDNRVNKIGSMAFTYTLVENVQLNNVKRIEDQAFFQSGFLKSVKISENCNYIGNMGFAYCTKLENIVIPDRTTIADEGIFACCINLNKVVLSSSIQKVPQTMFMYCLSLSEIYIPKSVASVDMSAFATSEKLQTVYYEGTEEEWNKINVEEHNEPLLNATVIFNSNPEMIGIGNIDADTLTAAIEKFSEFNSADYSESSYNNLKDIVNRNKELVDTAQSQEEIDFAVTEILEAIYDLQPYLNLTVSAENGSYEVTCDGNASSDNKYSLLFGTEITLSATANEGYEFVGWYDVTNNLYFSTNSTYTFKLTENTNLKAVFVKEQSATLTFTTYSNWVQSTVTKTIDEWNNVTSIEDLLPQIPYKYGYSNGRWVYDNDEVLAKLRAGESVFLIPEYDEDDTSLPTPREPENGVPALDLYYKLDADANVGSFVMAAGIPDDCQIESVGVAFYYKKANDFDPTNFELLINNKMLVSRFNTEEIEDIYIVNMNKLTSTYNWAVRGYVTYYDADGNLKTAYSNQVNIVNREQV